MAHPDASGITSCRLPMLTESEEHQQLVEWNSYALDYPVADARCTGCSSRARRQSPDAIALHADGVDYSYRELNRTRQQAGSGS